MQSEMTDSASASLSAVASNIIRIDGVLLLTGMLGFGFLLLSWTLAIGSVALAAAAAYFAIMGETSQAVVAVISAIIVALSWFITRWIARGLLEGRKARAIVACILMIGFASIIGVTLVSGESTPAMASTDVANAVVAVLASVLSLLLIASFRNRPYWGRAR
jgi:hypothetical protein